MKAIDSGAAQEIKKYDTYYIEVDPNQGDKASEIKLCSFARPHMRAFHCAWFSFFIAFCIWFAVAPLLSEIQTTLKITKQEIWTSNIIGVGGTIFLRFIIGPACDKFGARVLFSILLCTAAIPTAMVGLVTNADGLYVIRLFIGIAGATFVTTQYWMSMMFAKEVVGTANAVTAGWGNLGGGVIQLVVGSGIFPLIKAINGNNAENAWRVSTIPPAIVGFITGIIIYFISDDAPKGNYSEMKKNGTMPEVSAAASFRAGAVNFNSWVLFLQYAACFGVELTMNNAAALYFKEEFKQSTESAAAIASIFGWMNLFARGLGGFVSDKLSARMGMKGRIWAQAIMLLGEGIFVLIFANTKSLGVAIFIMVMFSIFVQGAEGSTFGIVPYVDPPATGSISGIVGAGGNIGAVLFGLCFRQLSYVTAFYIMGSVIVASAFASVFIIIKGSSSILCGGTDTPTPTKTTETIEVPEVDSNKMKEIETREPAKGDSNVDAYEAEA